LDFAAYFSFPGTPGRSPAAARKGWPHKWQSGSQITGDKIAGATYRF